MNHFRVRRAMVWLCVALTVVLCASFAAAQGIVTGSISGTVEDAQGAMVTGAKVTAKHLATNRNYTTDSTFGWCRFAADPAAG